MNQESNFGFGMDKRSSYVILFNSRRWIDLITQILLFMILIDPIQYHRGVIYPIELTGERFIISMGLNPELLPKKNNEIMEVNILAFIATALFILIPTAFLLIIYVKTVSQGD